MFVIAIANGLLGWFAAGFDPRLESLGLAFGVLMTGLAAFVTIPTALRRFPVPVGPLMVKSLALPFLAAIPGVVAIAWRPRLGQPIMDFVVDGVVFCLISAPGLEALRRRMLRAAVEPQGIRNDG
jgi:hypothetical protein